MQIEAGYWYVFTAQCNFDALAPEEKVLKKIETKSDSLCKTETAPNRCEAFRGGAS